MSSVTTALAISILCEKGRTQMFSEK